MAKRIVAVRYGAPSEVLELHEVRVPRPGRGEVTIEVRAAGVNPADGKRVLGAFGADESLLPLPIGYEVAGVIAAIGPDTAIASGPAVLGDPVIAFRVSGGYADSLTVPAADVFAKPETLDFAQASGLLLVGATAADMLRAVPVTAGDTALVHGASGAVGASLLQQLGRIGARVVGTARQDRLESVARFGAEPVAYGPGLLDRLREHAPGFTAVYDTSGNDEAIDASLELLTDPGRLVSIAAFGRAQADGFQILAGSDPASASFRNSVRGHLVQLAAEHHLSVPMARTFPLADAGAALDYLASGQAHGKVALIA